MNATAQPDMLERAGLAKPKRKSQRSKACDELDLQIRSHKIEGFEREHKFAICEGRAYRFDFANKALRLAVEVEGIVVLNIDGRRICTGRHMTPDGFREDCIKYALGIELGWYVLRVEQSMIRSDLAIELLYRCIYAIKERTPR